MAWYHVHRPTIKKVHYFRHSDQEISDSIIGPICSNVSLLHSDLYFCADPENSDYCNRCYAKLSKENPEAIIFRKTRSQLKNFATLQNSESRRYSGHT